MELNDWADVRVTRNLLDALRALRRKGGARTLWMDALSINQLDPVEKTSQMSKMGEIYSLADQVLVWLGLTSEPVINPPTLMSLEKIQNLSLMSCIWSAPSEWWTRAWTVQEYVMASRPPRFCFGTHEVSSRYVEDVLDKACEQGASVVEDLGSARLHTFWQHMKALRELRLRRSCFGDRLLGFVPRILELYAAYPQDKVYSLLGVLAGSEGRLIEPDYRKTAGEVFAEATLASIESSKSLDILLYVQTGKRQRAQLASWIVDFDTPRKGFSHQIDLIAQWNASDPMYGMAKSLRSTRQG